MIHKCYHIGLPVHRFAPLTAKRINRYLIPTVAQIPLHSSPSFRSDPFPMPAPEGRLHASFHPVKGLFSSPPQGSSLRSLADKTKEKNTEMGKKRDALKRHPFSHLYQFPIMNFTAFSACPAAMTIILRSSRNARNHPCK